MTENKDLCVVTGNLVVAKEVFAEGGAEKLLEPLRKKLKEFVPDVTTKKGRDEIKSFAAKYSKSKTLVDKLGKGLKDEYKVLIDPIDKERKIFRDACDEMRDEARKPLTDYEEEQKILEDIERAKVEMELDWDEALTMNDFVDREREVIRREAELAQIETDRIAKEKEAQAEKDRIEYEAKIKADAEAQAKKDAEESLLKEQQEKERLIQEARQREEQAKIDAENAEKQRLADIEAEKQRAEREKHEALAKQKREQEEKERAEVKRIADEKAEEERKSRNKNHQKAVNRKVVAKLMSVFTSDSDKVHISEAHAIEIVKELIKNPIPEISINY